MKAVIGSGTRLLLIGCLIALTGCGLTASKRSEGYADLDALRVPGLRTTASLSVGRVPLRIAGRFAMDTPEGQQLFRGLHGVRVRVYELDERSRSAFNTGVEQLLQQLKNEGWEPAVVVREAGELVQILVKLEEEILQGMTIVVREKEEATVVNLMGELKPDDLLASAEFFDTDILQSLGNVPKENQE